MLKRGEMMGRYRIERTLGRGGMGTVYLAWDGALAREVAIKVVSAREHRFENAIARFRQEARAIAGLDNPHIIRIHDFLDTPETAYIVMEYVNGETLSSCLARRGRLPQDMVMDYALQMLDGLACAHGQGIIHRDIKPANILISRSGIVKLSDFGLAKSLYAESDLTESGMAVGTVHYLSPETARGESATTASDIYSLGVTLYECLAGKPPIDEESPLKALSRIANEAPPHITSFRADLPAGLSAWIMRLLAYDPAQRYPDAIDALRDARTIASACMKQARPRDPDETSDSIHALHQPPRMTEDVSEAWSGGYAASAHAPQSAADAPALQDSGVRIESVDTIMVRALKLEHERENRLTLDSFLQIAAEAGVSPECAREAYRQHRAARGHRSRQRTVAIVAGACVLGLIVASMMGISVLELCILGALGGLLWGGVTIWKRPPSAAVPEAPAVGKRRQGLWIAGGVGVALVLLFLFFAVMISERQFAEMAEKRRSVSVNEVKPIWEGTHLQTRSGDLLAVRDHSGKPRASAPSSPIRATSVMTAGEDSWEVAGLTLDAKSPVLYLRPLSQEGAGGDVSFRVGGGGPHPPVGKLYYGLAGRGGVAVRASGGTCRVQMAAACSIPIAVLPFTGSNAAAAAATGDAISARLAQTGAFTVIERIQIDKVMQNLALENTAYFDPATAGKMGQLLGVEELVVGSMQEAAGQVRLTLRRVDAQTGMTRNSETVEGPLSRLFPLQDTLARTFADAIISSELDRLADEP